MAVSRVYEVTAPGGPFRSADIPRPVPAAGQVLVRIHAAGLNPLDTKIRNGKADHARQPLPAVLGVDMAGVVEEAGDGVTTFRRGDAVYGMAGGVGGLPGTLAEFIAADADLVAHKPANLSMREAAALPLSVITAWEGLVDRANVRPGQKVLVHGGAGGIGHIAVQLARAYGAEVFATVSPAKAEIVKGFGATPIDYQRVSLEQYVAAHTEGRGFDIVYDTVGGATLDASLAAVKRYTVMRSVAWVGERIPWRRCPSLAPLTQACSPCFRC
jgi:NADPH2:quinone reductase